MKRKQILRYAAFLAAVGALIGIVLEINKRVNKRLTILNSYRAYYELILQWMKNRDNVLRNFMENNYKKIGIYGLGTLGEVLYDNISKTDVKIACFIEKKPIITAKYDIPMASINDASSYENLDAIIVTPVNYFDQIKSDLINAGVKARIVSLEDIIFGN